MATFPKECRMHSHVACRELSVTINTRPVPKTNYNIDQLSDMFHRLQEQFTTTVEKQAKEIEELKEEVAELKMHTNCNLWNLIKDVEHLDNMVTRLSTDLDEFTEWSDRVCIDTEKIKSDVK
jgi:predicted RNase H-like nuclease (RuvC/YqgF family)